jgi:hypothetical protein
VTKKAHRLLGLGIILAAAAGLLRLFLGRRPPADKIRGLIHLAEALLAVGIGIAFLGALFFRDASAANTNPVPTTILTQD